MWEEVHAFYPWKQMHAYVCCPRIRKLGRMRARTNTRAKTHKHRGETRSRASGRPSGNNIVFHGDAWCGTAERRIAASGDRSIAKGAFQTLWCLLHLLLFLSLPPPSSTLYEINARLYPSFRVDKTFSPPRIGSKNIRVRLF